MRSARALLLLLLPILAAAPAPSRAEETPGRIEGKVVDASGAPLPRIRVTAVGPVRREAFSGTGGAYRIAPLPPGSYRVTAAVAGFRTDQKTVTVPAGGAAEALLTLGPGREEAVTVTASRVETLVEDAPATVTVLRAADLKLRPATSWADVLRTVPGVNATQNSARDETVTSRQAASFFSGAQLALVDGRPLFFDFFNLVFWDLNSLGVGDLDQVEVLRGPASVMWGPNAATGVVNLITKSPREASGTSIDLRGGFFTRPDSGLDPGSTAGVDAAWAGALSEQLAARVSVGYLRSQAYARPTGSVLPTGAPLDPSVQVGGGSYADVTYVNRGTEQPRVDVRVDQNVGETGLVVYSGGYAGTQGILQTPIGPFDLEHGTGLGYGRVAYSQGGLQLSAFGNRVSGTAPNLITRAADGGPLVFDFADGQYNVDGTYRRLFGRHLLSAGLNARYNTFSVGLAPAARHRFDTGAWGQGDLDLAPLSVSVAARVDKPENLANALVSPRLAVAWAPAEAHVFRASYNRGYRIPSAVENHLDMWIVGGEFPLGAVDPSLGDAVFPIVSHAVGNPNLKAQALDAWELSWQGRVDRIRLGVSLYLNDTHDVISSAGTDLAYATAGIDQYYTSSDPPPGWPLPPWVLDMLAARGILFQKESYFLNVGTIRNQGIELSYQQPVTDAVSLFANYSFQEMPKLRYGPADPRGQRPENVDVPPRHRLNFGGSVTTPRWFGSLVVNYTDEAYWAETLNPTFFGYTPSYILVNASLGRFWSEGRVTTALRATNLTGQKVQQSMFADMLGRTVILDVGVRF